MLRCLISSAERITHGLPSPISLSESGSHYARALLMWFAYKKGKMAVSLSKKRRKWQHRCPRNGAHPRGCRDGASQPAIASANQRLSIITSANQRQPNIMTANQRDWGHFPDTHPRGWFNQPRGLIAVAQPPHSFANQRTLGSPISVPEPGGCVTWKTTFR